MKIKNSEMSFINQGKISAHFRANKFLKIVNWDAICAEWPPKRNSKHLDN